MHRKLLANFRAALAILLAPLLIAPGVIVLGSARAVAQVSGANALADEVANREPRTCDLPDQADDLGRSLWAANLWPGGVVPYQFDANTSAGNQSAMRLAMDELERVAYVHFVPRAGQANYLHVQDSTGNNSFVGMIGGGQTVNIYNWNYRFIMCHELMHALGVYHEQQRADRSVYITVNYGNIQAGWSSNYDIRFIAAIQGSFDFDSVMLYGACSASICCPANSNCDCASNCWTMTAKPAFAQFQGLMGQRTHLSTGDVAGLVSRYGGPTCPAFTRQPTNVVANAGAAVSFSSIASGSPAPTYRWRRNGLTLSDDGRIVGSTTQTLTINAMVTGDAALYDCVATNSCGSATSDLAELLVGYPNVWTIAPAPGPSARTVHAMAYDSVREEVVLFGGDTGTANGETWVRHAGQWTQRLVSGPSPRFHCASAFDSTRGVTILFGGIASGTNGETWEWNGTAWTPRIAAGPSDRFATRMCFDSGRGVTVLFGGWTGTANGETWEWDGLTWTQRVGGGGPSPRVAHAMAYDSGRGVTVLFGGETAAGVNGETWEWNGTAWTQRTVTGPSP
ncbi:MAG: M12 family metallopeptidase, partial [Planctomycetota bacterium]